MGIRHDHMTLLSAQPIAGNHFQIVSECGSNLRNLITNTLSFLQLAASPSRLVLRSRLFILKPQDTTSTRFPSMTYTGPTWIPSRCSNTTWTRQTDHMREVSNCRIQSTITKQPCHSFWKATGGAHWFPIPLVTFACMPPFNHLQQLEQHFISSYQRTISFPFITQRLRKTRTTDQQQRPSFQTIQA